MRCLISQDLAHRSIIGLKTRAETLESSFWREVVTTLLIAVVLFLGIHFSVLNTEIISGSMQPTLAIGDWVLISKLAYSFGGSPHRGDIIVFVPPASLDSENDYIKRIIGLPGEVVELKSGKVYIHKVDGSVITLDESYIGTPSLQDYISDVIPPGNYFVMGDNRNNSGDSRMGWTVPRKNVVGKAWLIIWPPPAWGAAPNYALP